MLQSLGVMLREGLEAALVVGIILAYLRKVGAADRAAAVWVGVAAAVAVSAVMGGVLFWTVGELDGKAEMLYEGTAMLTAVVILTWMVFWMRRQARTAGNALRDRVALALSSGSGVALASVAFVAVAREGIESALFMFTATQESTPEQALIGGTIGTAVAVGVGAMVYRGTSHLDLRKFFMVTSGILFVFAAYLLHGAIAEFAEAGLLGGEGMAEVGSIVAAAVYGVTVAWLYFGRPARTAAPSAAQA
jgi:high-affinity iron transporter